MDKKKVTIALMATLVGLSGLSVSSSLAWYAASMRLQVNYIEMSILGDRELRIGVNENDKREELTTGDLKKVPLFAPVSTMFESRWHKNGNLPRFYEYSSFLTPSSGVPYGPFEANSGFYTQTLYLTCDDDVYVGLDVASSYLRADVSANEAKARSAGGSEEEIAAKLEKLNSIEKAMRVSILDIETDSYYIVDPHKEKDTVYGGILSLSLEGHYDTYFDAQGIELETVYGEINDRSRIVYGEALAEASVVEGEPSCFNSAHKKGVKPFLLEESLQNGLQFKIEDSLSFEELTSGNPNENPLVITLERDKPKAIQMSIYLEGWDEDCINVNMGASFEAKLQFKILREKTS